MKKTDLIIKVNEQIARDTFKMVLGCEKEGHGITAPGQFINIRIEGHFLRRPISVSSWEDDEITIVYKVVGHGTEKLSGYAAGRSLDVLTPLGNGYDIGGGAILGRNGSVGGCPVLIGGGAGVPPMYGLCRELLKNGVSPSVILGFNMKDEVFYTEEFRDLGVDTVITTADGSMGRKGLVTDALADTVCSYIFACGPEVMLKAVDAAADPQTGAQFSFEERMGCGFGACMGCSCETRYGYKRICKDGPVLERGEIIW